MTGIEEFISEQVKTPCWQVRAGCRIPSLCRGGVRKAIKSNFFPRTGGFEASREVSSPNLGLVGLKRVMVVNWPGTVVCQYWFSLGFVEPVCQQGSSSGSQKRIRPLFMLSDFCLESEE